MRTLRNQDLAAAATEVGFPQSINGFPITYRNVTLSNGEVVTVPRGISRNENYWRVFVAHEKGEFTTYVHDDPSPTESLRRAVDLLFEVLRNGVSRFSVDKRERTPGQGRDPLIDTGVTGVSISRSVRRNLKQVIITVDQMLQRPNKQVEARKRYVGTITEEALADDPIGQEQRFREMLQRGVAIRRYYNHQRANGIYPAKPYSFDDVPASIREKPVEMPDLDLQAIFDSYTVIPKPIPPRTTGGDPDALAVRLQSADLSQPQKAVYLEGRYIKFYRTDVEGFTFWLPRSLGRARDHWRIKCQHRDGWICDSVYDEECGGDLRASLKEAWLYLVSLYRSTEAPSQRSKASVEPLLCTGVTGVFIQPQRRISQIGVTSWTFSVVVAQEVAPDLFQRQSVGHWKLNEVTDNALADALCRATAMIRYRDHLMAQGYSLRDCYVLRSEAIPDAFWPAEPVCPIYADDLRYIAEQKDRQ